MLALMLAFAAATIENEILLRYNTSTMVFETLGYVWSTKTLDPIPDY